MKKSFILQQTSLIGILVLSACQSLPFKIPDTQGRTALAHSIAQTGKLVRQDIHSGSQTLASWRRINAPGQPVNIYIEGDGLAWISKYQKSPDPTPTDPVGLRLAAADPSANVIYIARPCQYTLSASCYPASWTSERFTPAAIHTMNEAVNIVQKQNPSAGIHLIGYSGGGNIAAILAGQREDVISLRTVAASLDIAAFNNHHKTTPMPQSVSAADYPGRLRHIPQIHFIGAKDKIVPQIIYQSYKTKLGNSSCLQSHYISNASHTEGWDQKWPELLSITPKC